MLSILDLNTYTDGFKRPIVEGEAYYDSGLLFGVGLLSKDGSVLKVQGLAVQTSNTTGKPHEIDVTFDTSKDPGDRISYLECSCIAGKSEKCKHAVATILWLTRNCEDDLADVSCTDLAQQWGTLKLSGKPVLEGCPLTELCHVKKKKIAPMPEVTEEMRSKWRDILLKCKSPV